MQLGRYSLQGKLATGGMAEVFLARLVLDGGFERTVVIKRVLPQYARDPEFLRLFQQEARFASFLSHPNIAQVSDFGVDDAGGAYLVMEYVDGASLRELIRCAAAANERTDPRLLCRVFSQVAEALGAVHGATDPGTRAPLELIHRDVSPENVLLSRQGAVKLADFGIARATSEANTTDPNVMRGKLRYLAPEQVLGLPLGPAVDVWALGVTLYEALTLQRPFPEDNDGQTVHAIVNGALRAPLEQLRPDLPEPLVAVVRRCLAREPEQRFADCHDLALELERVASSAGNVTAKLIGNWVERLVPQTPGLRPLDVAPPEPSPGRGAFGAPGSHWAEEPRADAEPSQNGSAALGAEGEPQASQKPLDAEPRQNAQGDAGASSRWREEPRVDAESTQKARGDAGVGSRWPEPRVDAESTQTARGVGSRWPEPRVDAENTQTARGGAGVGSPEPRVDAESTQTARGGAGVGSPEPRVDAESTQTARGGAGVGSRWPEEPRADAEPSQDARRDSGSTARPEDEPQKSAAAPPAFSPGDRWHGDQPETPVTPVVEPSQNVRHGDQPLELGRALRADAPAPPPEEVEAPRPRRGLIIGALVVIVIALGAGAWRLRAPTLSLRQVVITSSPTGATLHHGDRVLGVTPWAGDLPDVAVELTLTAPGRKSTRVVLPPGESAPVDVQLAH